MTNASGLERGSVSSLAARFRENSYVVIRSAISEADREFLYEYVLATLKRKGRVKGDSQVPGTPFVYGDFAMETLLEKMLPELESLLGIELFPTYSYLRLYKNGDRLEKHTDRPACEISCTLCLGYTAETPWPIWVERNSIPVCVTLRRADMLVYRGMEVSHWREQYEGEQLAQVFLHYVDQRGPCREWKYDKRTGLRTPMTHSV
jgi:hypothetical protein